MKMDFLNFNYTVSRPYVFGDTRIGGTNAVEIYFTHLVMKVVFFKAQMLLHAMDVF